MRPVVCLGEQVVRLAGEGPAGTDATGVLRAAHDDEFSEPHGNVTTET
jgi:hypothetical protein